MHGDADLVVVGAGVIGAWAALLAARAGARVVVLDQSSAGGGATARAAALDFPYATTPWRRHLARLSASLIQDLLKTNSECWPHRSLPIFFVASRNRWPSVETNVISAGLRLANRGDLEQIRCAVPSLAISSDSVIGAGLTCRVVSSREATLRLLDLATQQYGAAVWQGCHVSKIDRVGGCRVHIATGGTLSSRAVVWATGPWLERLPADVRTALKVRVKRVVSLHIAAPVSASPAVAFSVAGGEFIQPEPGDRWLFSYTREVWDVTPRGTATAISMEDIDAGMPYLHKLAPSLVGGCRSGVAFCDAYGPDREPVAALWPGMPTTVAFAGAGSGSGVRLAPGIAWHALRLVMPDLVAAWPHPQEHYRC